MAVVTIKTFNDDGETVKIERTTYEYSEDGIRVSALHEVDVDGDGIFDTAKLTEYLNDPLNITGYSQVLKQTETDLKTNEQTITTYVIGHQRISQTVIKDGSKQEYYFTFDGHGSTRALTDAIGAIVELYAYNAFGNALGFDPSIALTEFLYSGEQFDSKIGQQYLRQRYYDPSTGRFNRLDPFFGNLNDPQSLHKYLYTHANPINGVDPSGKSLGGIAISVSIGAAIGAGVGYYRNGVNGALVGALAGGAAGAAVLYMPILGSSFLRMLATGTLSGFVGGAINGLIYNSLVSETGELNINIKRGTWGAFTEGIMGAFIGAGTGLIGGGVLYAGSLIIQRSPMIRGVVAECITAAQRLNCPITKQPLFRFDLSKFLNNSNLKGDIGEATDRAIFDMFEWLGNGMYTTRNGIDNVFYSPSTGKMIVSEAKYAKGWNASKTSPNSLLDTTQHGKQMSDRWIDYVAGKLIANGNEIGSKITTAQNLHQLEKQVTVVNEFGDYFVYIWNNNNSKWEYMP